MDTITKKIRCSGKMHRVSIMSNGPITLHNHTRAELAADRIMVALGGEECRCQQFLRAWRNKDWDKLPSWARKAFMELCWNNKRYCRSVIFAAADPLTRPIVYRLRKKLIALIKIVIMSCNYKTSKTQNNSILTNYYLTAIDMGAYPIMYYKAERSNRYIKIKLNVFRWHNHVYKHGLAVVDGVFVLDVLLQDENGYTVLAGRQNKDLSINIVNARITADATGVKMLTWLDDTKGG